MSSNRFTRFSPQQYISTVIPLPFEEILQVGAVKQKNQDDAQAELAQIDAGVKSVNALPGDRDYAQKAITDIHNNIDQFTTMDFNDPSVRANWNKTKASITQRFMPTGDLGMIDSNYKLYTDWNKNFLESGQKAGWGSDQLQRQSNNIANSFTTLDQNGNMRMFQGEGVANRVDYNDWISKSLKDVAADTGNIGLTKYGSLDEINTAYQSGTIEHKDYQKIMNALALRAQGDPALIQSLEQEGKFNGQEGWGNFVKGSDKDGNIIVDTTNPFGAMLTGASYGAQYKKVDMKYQVVGDPLKEYQAKKNIDKADETPKSITLGNITTTSNNPYAKYKASVHTASTTTGTNITPGEVKGGIRQSSINGAHTTTTKSVNFTPEQQALYDQAIMAYGLDPNKDRDAEDKVNILNKYIDTKGSFNNNQSINLFSVGDDPVKTQKYIKNNDAILFGERTNTAGVAAQRQFKLISGDGEQEGSGSEVLNDYADPKKYKVTSIGTLTPDNTYFSAGEVVQVTDLETGKIVSTYAMAGTNEEQAQQTQENAAYKAKYAPDGKSKVSFATTDGGQQAFQLQWVPRVASFTDDGLIKSGDINDPNNSKISEQLIVTPLDGNGQPIEGETKNYQSNVNDEYQGDVIQMWYSSLKNPNQQ